MKRLRSNLFICFYLVLSILFFSGTDAKATEKGVSSGQNGATDFMAGAVPPPGFYYLNYLNYYTADTVKEKNGN